jgi:hypothetical protein
MGFYNLPICFRVTGCSCQSMIKHFQLKRRNLQLLTFQIHPSLIKIPLCTSQAVTHSRYAPNVSMDSIPAAAMMYRPISAPPKPGYTQASGSSRSATLPATPYKYTNLFQPHFPMNPDFHGMILFRFNDYPGRSHTR